MRKLTRPKDPPKCIARAQANGATNWERLRGGDRRQIWDKLNEMQFMLCAYCESTFTKEDSHIEHLYPRSKYEGLTFEWKNLFGSCNNEFTCGIFKDSARNPHQVNHELLIKPDQDDPREYFRYYKNGRISAKSGLTDEQYWRAKETIKAFNLNKNSLARMRERHLEPLKQLEEEFILWCDMCEDDPELLDDLEFEIRTLLSEQVDTAYQSIKQHYIHYYLDLLELVSEAEEIRFAAEPKQRQKQCQY
ncbi:TIGR02646 family protein [Ignatzschineria rhizosphaerae]|uniref:TIGR02646 family protein n=1 Tax=Ignatzschineria rhizosphaerae TaxID=2923279 RepID=A0ABY3X347_9GAMM|nr:retron Ec78 anti-phage system effector HNH endonuclease PtuB [Ignatzschineria rhizosphaerae]UNM95882.1 TIGR02646 family protein [Ignatzschineria rhizosphaerae]